jgi:hypothetical protein
MKFKNISVCQIIGSLAYSRQSGEFIFNHKNGEIRAWLDFGNVFSIRTNTLSNYEALKVSAWVFEGDIKQQNSNFPVKSMEYDAEAEKFLLEEASNIDNITFFENATIQKTSKMLNGASVFYQQVEKINNAHPNGFIYTDIRKEFGFSEMLRAIAYGTFVGSYLVDYKQTIGATLKKFQDAMASEIKTFYGQGLASSFGTVVEKELQDYYSKVTLDQTLLGTDPFRVWFDSIENEGKKIGKSGLFEKWVSKIKSKFSLKEIVYLESL